MGEDKRGGRHEEEAQDNEKNREGEGEETRCLSGHLKDGFQFPLSKSQVCLFSESGDISQQMHFF